MIKLMIFYDLIHNISQKKNRLTHKTRLFVNKQ